MDEVAVASVMAAPPPRTTSRRVIKRSFSTVTPPGARESYAGNAMQADARHADEMAGRHRTSGEFERRGDGRAAPSNRAHVACFV
jgi:hypothetical protein